MSPSTYDPRRTCPEEEERRPPDASKSFKTFYPLPAPYTGYSQTSKESNAWAWEQTWGSNVGTRNSESKGERSLPVNFSSQSSVRQYSEKYFQQLHAHGNLRPHEDRYAGLSTRQPGHQPDIDATAYPPPSVSNEFASTPNSFPHVARRSHRPPAQAELPPQKDRGSKRNMPEYYSRASNSPSWSDRRSYDDEDSRYSKRELHDPYEDYDEELGDRRDERRKNDSRWELFVIDEEE